MTTAALNVPTNLARPASDVAGRPLRVVQTVLGRFHHFDLARQLHRHGCLRMIFSGYPWWKLRQEGIPRESVRTFPWLMAPLMAKWRYGWRHHRLDRELSLLAAATLDGHVSRNLPECDVFIAISGSGLKTAHVARARGARYICDRGSAHVGFVDELLTEEFARWGQKFPPIEPRAIAKEEAEYALADAVTIPSEFARRTYIQKGVPAAKLKVIPYGAEVGRFRPGPPPPADTFEVLYVGQVSFRKGLPYLLEAFSRVRHPKKRLTIAGALCPEMSLYLQGKQFESVRFLGPQPRDAVALLMQQAHVFVLPSVEDGFGMVLAEAMACGCPIIGSENTGAPDLLQDSGAGFVVPIRDAIVLRDRLEQVGGDRALRDRMAAAASARVREIGGWSDYGDGYVGMLRELCGGREAVAGEGLGL